MSLFYISVSFFISIDYRQALKIQLIICRCLAESLFQPPRIRIQFAKTLDFF